MLIISLKSDPYMNIWHQMFSYWLGLLKPFKPVDIIRFFINLYFKVLTFSDGVVVVVVCEGINTTFKL